MRLAAFILALMFLAMIAPAHAASLPDYVVASIVPPKPMLAGAFVTFSGAVKNAGGSTSSGVPAAFFIDGGMVDSPVWTTPLPAGGKSNVTSGTWKATAGPHVLRIASNYGHKLPESDTTNDDTTLDFEVLPALSQRPDLTVGAISWAPTSPQSGDEVTFQVLVKNVAAIATSSAPALSLLINGTALPIALREGPLNGSDSATASATWIAQAGLIPITARVDPADAILESNETNNARIATITIQGAPLPDLRIENVTWEGPLIAGSPVDLSIVVLNAGPGAAPASKVDLTLDEGSVVVSRGLPVIPLAPGSRAALSTRWENAIPGPHALTARIDPDRRIMGATRSNNSFTKLMDVVMIPDANLTVQSADYVEGPGSMLGTLKMTLKNTGGRASPEGPLNVSIDDGKVLLDFHLPSLPPGQTLSLNASLPALAQGVHPAVFTRGSAPISARLLAAAGSAPSSARAAAAGNSAAEDKGVPGVGVALLAMAVVGVALVARRRR